MELNWVKPKGRKNVPGKPIQYGTTDDFLEAFGLGKISEIPKLKEIVEFTQDEELPNDMQVDIFSNDSVPEEE